MLTVERERVRAAQALSAQVMMEGERARGRVTRPACAWGATAAIAAGGSGVSPPRQAPPVRARSARAPRALKSSAGTAGARRRGSGAWASRGRAARGAPPRSRGPGRVPGGAGVPRAGARRRAGSWAPAVAGGSTAPTPTPAVGTTAAGAAGCPGGPSGPRRAARGGSARGCSARGSS